MLKNTKICKECGDKFDRPIVNHGSKKKYPLSITLWKKRVYCSNSCSGKNKPRKYGSDHWNWKGKDVGYRGIHHWVRKTLGKAVVCLNCDATNDRMRIHWANKNHKYERDIDQWIPLCAKCHGEFDKLNKLRKRK